MRARGRMADCSDPAHAWSTYRMRVLSSFWAWLDGPLNNQDRPGNAVAAAGGGAAPVVAGAADEAAEVAEADADEDA